MLRVGYSVLFNGGCCAIRKGMVFMIVVSAVCNSCSVALNYLESR